MRIFEHSEQKDTADRLFLSSVICFESVFEFSVKTENKNTVTDLEIL